MSKEKEQTKTGGVKLFHVVEVDGEAVNEKKLLRRLDLHLVPGLCLLFLLSFMDRTNGNPSLSFP